MDNGSLTRTEINKGIIKHADGIAEILGYHLWKYTGAITILIEDGKVTNIEEKTTLEGWDDD